MEDRITELEQRLAACERREQRLGRQVRGAWATTGLMALLAVALIGAPGYTAQRLPPIKQRVATLETKMTQVQGLLAGFSRNGSELTLTGMNVHLLNGLGFTDTANGVGNLILGYNQVRQQGDGPDVRTGSHNLVIGDGQNYTGGGGIVNGYICNQNADGGAILGGFKNTVSDARAVVCGGAFQSNGTPDTTVVGQAPPP